jgi:hypothetical protein
LLDALSEKKEARTHHQRPENGKEFFTIFSLPTPKSA